MIEPRRIQVDPDSPEAAAVELAALFLREKSAAHPLRSGAEQIIEAWTMPTRLPVGTILVSRK